MKINKRLQAIGDLITDNSYILDIGCDHALLDIYVVKSKNNIHAIASDINELPLKQAKINVDKYGVSNQVKCIQGNGLKPITKDVNTVVISGMGGKNILGIIKYDQNLLANVNNIIISPNNDIIAIRKFLLKNNYYLINEVLVEENNIIYQILSFKKGHYHYAAKDYYFGPILRQNKDKLFIKYYNLELQRKNILLKLIPKKNLIKRFRIKQEIKLIKNEIEM